MHADSLIDSEFVPVFIQKQLLTKRFYLLADHRITPCVKAGHRSDES